MSDPNRLDTSTVVEDKGIQVFRCSCGKEFDVTGYPVGYKFACPTCHAFCEVKDPDEELPAGAILSDFQVHERIGGGGMGIVYLGRQLSLDRPVAIKALKKSIAGNEDFIRRFTMEARTAAQIIHNNIVQIYFVGQEGNTFFIAMEYVNGRSVRELINEGGAMDEARALDIVFQASLGLHRAHGMNILHRDIKPDNLMLNRMGEVKLADFGLALDLGESKRHGGIQKLEGSPHYMSPEQATGGELTFSSDIYSLGATLYHMVTSQPPFTGKSPAAIVAKHVTDYPRSPRELNGSLSRGICLVIQKMMAKRPEERFSGSEELLRELDSLRSEHGRPLASGVMHWFMEERDDSSRLRDLTAVLDVNRVISQEKDPDRLLLRIVHEITAAMKAERSTLYLYDGDTDEIWAKVAEGVSDSGIIRLPLGKGIAGTAARDLRTEVINDPYSDPRFNREVDAKTGFRTRNMICMPVLGSEVELLGVIQVLNKKSGGFDYNDESILSTLAVHVGLALERNLYFCPARPTCKEVPR
ncbi:MAG: protein kinase [Deltaproteobacteria bacterium]|nr:protein kinase [Deltaproteobacteria bacterium]